MGNSEEVKPAKLEKPSSPMPDQPNMHVYPDWAAMQAYYGPRVAVPSYFNPAIPPGHAPHPYMWAPPQAMMPPYGPPFAAIYAHGGVYAHPGVPLVPNPPSIEAPGKSSGNTDRGLMKKLKEFDGLAMSIGNGNGNADSTDGGADRGISPSGETEGSSDGSDGNTAGASQNSRKRSRDGTPALSGDRKIEIQSGIAPPGYVNKAASEKLSGVTVAGIVVGSLLCPNITTTALELGNPSPDQKSSRTSVPQPCAMIPNETWVQNERELKRERRKQSNRESARRSRLRKQAETEELAVRVDSLTAENMTLKSEFSLLTENSEKLKLENASLMEKLKKVQKLRQSENNGIANKVDAGQHQIGTENLLSRVNNSGSVDLEEEDSGTYGNNNNNNNKKSGAKLRQLLGTSPRTDAAVAAT